MSGIEYAFETFCALSQYYSDKAQEYRQASTHVTKQQVKQSGITRKSLARHYRNMSVVAEQKARQYSDKADRWLNQL